MTEALLQQEHAGAGAARRASIAALFRPYSLESTTQPRAVEDTLGASLPRGTSVYLTSLPGASPEDLVAAAIRLAAAGLNPVPHLAARAFLSTAAADQCLERLVAEARVRQALVIGGDLDQPRGSFIASRDLIETGLLEKHGITTVGLAAYPEGHARIPEEVLARELAAKIAALKSRGIAPYIVTQFCFEAPPIAALLARLAVQFPAIPVHIGLAGPAKLSTLLRYAASCGIGSSLRALRRQASLTKLMTMAGPEPVIAALASDALARAATTQLHFFTFGGIGRTAAWAEAIARGAFALAPDGSGLRVDLAGSDAPSQGA